MLELDRYAGIDSPISRWDARWKLLAAAVLIGCVISLHTLGCAALAGALAINAVLLARLPLLDVLRRLRAVLLLIAAVFVILALTGHGSRISIAGVELSLSGLGIACLVALKTLTVALIALLATATSPTQRTLAALRDLHVPDGLVQVLHLTYRYVFLLQAESRAIRTAMIARGFRFRPEPASLGLLGTCVGMLLIRSLERADRVYLSMQARGFDGHFRAGESRPTSSSDLLGLVLCAGLGEALVACDLLAG